MAVVDILERRGVNPIAILAQIAGSRSKKISPDTKLRAAAELAQYMYPKRKAVEITEAPHEAAKEFLPEWLQDQLRTQSEESSAQSQAGQPGDTPHSQPNGGSMATSGPDSKATPDPSAAVSPKPSVTRPSSWPN